MKYQENETPGRKKYQVKRVPGKIVP